MDNLDMVAAAEHLLECGGSVFSRKVETDRAWIILERAEQRVRGEGTTPLEACTDAFTAMGIGGLRWALKRLDVRARALDELIAGPIPRRRQPACRHGVSGGRCKECV